jgi:deoxyribodipyrimidine photo-lyase
MPWHPARESALRHLGGFIPSMGRAYQSRRNFDLGPGQRGNTSTLSPYLRRRLLTEREVVEAALEAHGLDGSEKFVQEVFWRTYFKGWLERRPSVWQRYLRLVGDAPTNLKAYKQAIAGETGIACFDAWARELTEHNYLHNHARMWFASIWIFTLRLPWALGADFMLRHLLDGDPASNTLSWRWVAGLHTKGKNYVAARWNIEKFTEGRFAPEPGELAEDPEPLAETFDPGPAHPIRTPRAPDASKPSVLLITAEDCAPGDLALPEAKAAATLRISARGAADAVVTFDRGALADTARRSGHANATEFDALDPQAIVDWAKAAGAEQIVTPFVPVGPTRDWLDAAEPAFAQTGLTLAEARRDWDTTIWPLATAGFFKVKKQIPRLIDDLSLR